MGLVDGPPSASILTNCHVFETPPLYPTAQSRHSSVHLSMPFGQVADESLRFLQVSRQVTHHLSRELGEENWSDVTSTGDARRARNHRIVELRSPIIGLVIFFAIRANILTFSYSYSGGFSRWSAMRVILQHSRGGADAVASSWC